MTLEFNKKQNGNIEIAQNQHGTRWSIEIEKSQIRMLIDYLESLSKDDTFYKTT